MEPEKSDVHTSATFLDTGLHPYLCKALSACQFVHPTPIQYHSLRTYLSSPSNLICRSKSGTGKTAAYLSIILNNLMTTSNEIENKTYTIILLPTRELAVQVYQSLSQLLTSAQSLKVDSENK